MLKLENLKSKKIENLNEIVGGTSGMGMDETAQGTCRCESGSGCSAYVWPDGDVTATGGVWNED